MNREIKDHRLAIARTAPGSKLVENLTADKEKLSSIVFRRQSQKKEKGCVVKALSLHAMGSKRRLRWWSNLKELPRLSLSYKRRQQETRKWRSLARKGLTG